VSQNEAIHITYLILKREVANIRFTLSQSDLTFTLNHHIATSTFLIFHAHV